MGGNLFGVVAEGVGGGVAEEAPGHGFGFEACPADGDFRGDAVVGERRRVASFGGEVVRDVMFAGVHGVVAGRGKEAHGTITGSKVVEKDGCRFLFIKSPIRSPGR